VDTFRGMGYGLLDELLTTAPRQPYPRRTFMGVKILLHDGEPISIALRRFRRLLDRHGVTYEMRAHRYYEKPSQARHRKKCHNWYFKRVYSREAERRAHFGSG
jgi:ribosomal protein S21